MDTSTATAAIAEVLKGKTFGKGGSMLTGTMVRSQAQYQPKQENIPCHRGITTDQVRFQLMPLNRQNYAGNIKQGVTILGVEGTMSGTEGVNAQSKTATPAITAQTILPDAAYNYLTQVTVNAIPYVETDNAAGGKTVTIG